MKAEEGSDRKPFGHEKVDDKLPPCSVMVRSGLPGAGRGVNAELGQPTTRSTWAAVEHKAFGGGAWPCKGGA